jgi:hypothetical protein
MKLQAQNVNRKEKEKALLAIPKKYGKKRKLRPHASL